MHNDNWTQGFHSYYAPMRQTPRNFVIVTPKQVYHYEDVTEEYVKAECEALASQDGKATYYTLSDGKTCVKTDVVWR